MYGTRTLGTSSRDELLLNTRWSATVFDRCGDSALPSVATALSQPEEALCVI